MSAIGLTWLIIVCSDSVYTFKSSTVWNQMCCEAVEKSRCMNITLKFYPKAIRSAVDRPRLMLDDLATRVQWREVGKRSPGDFSKRWTTRWDLYSEGSIYLERDKKSGIGVDIIKETDSSTRNSMNISSASRKEAGFVWIGVPWIALKFEPDMMRWINHSVIATRYGFHRRALQEIEKRQDCRVKTGQEEQRGDKKAGN